MSSRQTLVIGDIHGCYDEFQQLLDTVPLASDDRIVHIGDMIDRGPRPAAVVDFFMMHAPNTLTLMGNREDKHVRAFDGALGYATSREITRRQFGDAERYAEAVAFMRTLPLYLELPEAILIHGYFEPGVPAAQQHRDVLLGHLNGESYLQAAGYWHWYAHYNGDKPLIFGHREYPFLSYANRAYAIDTRCVYGGALTGLLLPDFRVYSVPARADHWSAVRARYANVP